MRKNKTAF